MLDLNKDVAVDTADVEDTAYAVFVESDIDVTVDSLAIVGQLDPLEMTDGRPRWTQSQIDLISKCNKIIKEWQDA